MGDFKKVLSESYVKKPVEVEAIQWTGDNLEEIKKVIRLKRYECLLILPNKSLEIRNKTNDYLQNRLFVGDYLVSPFASANCVHKESFEEQFIPKSDNDQDKITKLKCDFFDKIITQKDTNFLSLEDFVGRIVKVEKGIVYFASVDRIASFFDYSEICFRKVNYSYEEEEQLKKKMAEQVGGKLDRDVYKTDFPDGCYFDGVKVSDSQWQRKQ